MTEEKFEACIVQMTNHDKAGLKVIYEEYIRLIYTIVHGIVGHKEVAEDLTSEFFLKLYQTAPKYKSGNGHKKWMITIARNMCIDYLRTSGREINFEKPDQTMENRERGPEDVVIEAISIKEAFHLLNSNEREVMDLKIIGNYTFEEIADIVQKPMGTVTWLYRQGILKLRRCVNEIRG